MSVFEAVPVRGGDASSSNSPFGSSVKTILTFSIADGTRKKIATTADKKLSELIPVLNEKFEVPADRVY